jgi:hypothetical protein
MEIVCFWRGTQNRKFQFFSGLRFTLFAGGGFVLLAGMTLDELDDQIQACATLMNSRYGSVVFDEWAIVSLAKNQARVLLYTGPRNDDFLKNFVRDLGSLRQELLGGSYGPGDFEFSRHGIGTGIEAFLSLGSNVYLLCNHTQKTMDVITKNPRWLSAQVPFVEFAEKVRSNPLVSR